MQSHRVYFPGLNALRFYAAISVVVFHGTLDILGPAATAGRVELFHRLTLHGGEAVTLFFVLSGFLITYLLLSERQKYGRIDVRKFYTRRILRIWPLYYWVIFISVVGVPVVFSALGAVDRIPETPSAWIALAVIMLPTVAFLLVRGVPTLLDQLWSIGLEEFFYLVWPHALRRVWAILLTWLLIKSVVVVIALELDRAGGGYTIWAWVLFSLGVFRVEAMMIGAVFAMLLFEKSRFIPIIFDRRAQLAAITYFVVTIVLRPFSNHFTDLIFMVSCGVIIANSAANAEFRWRLENRFTTFLGNLSYGLYMYHTLIYYLLVQAGVVGGIWLYLLGILLTIMVAWASYELLEKPFLKLKDQKAQPSAPAELPLRQ